mmetsp:Transcript_40418/g.126482  ORF Transcript_40418/g.126482 Transcript_40418/m.126482 type:complete len:219 (-) Transcript_40418:1418-2074(-)
MPCTSSLDTSRLWKSASQRRRLARASLACTRAALRHAAKRFRRRCGSWRCSSSRSVAPMHETLCAATSTLPCICASSASAARSFAEPSDAAPAGSPAPPSPGEAGRASPMARILASSLRCWNTRSVAAACSRAAASRDASTSSTASCTCTSAASRACTSSRSRSSAVCHAVLARAMAAPTRSSVVMPSGLLLSWPPLRWVASAPSSVAAAVTLASSSR